MRDSLATAVLAVVLVACGDDGESSTSSGGASASATTTTNASTSSAASTTSGNGGATASSGSTGAETTTGAGGAAGSGGGAPCGIDFPPTTYVDLATATEIAIANDPPAAQGIFDFSIEYPAGAPGGALSYSAVVAKNAISTRIALSDDAGATWTYVADVNESFDLDVPVAPTSQKGCPGNVCSGRFIHEVSTLVFDADDPDASRRWKVFAHSYLVGTGDALYRDLGFISLFTAAEPFDTWTFEGNVIGWNGESTLSSEGALTNLQDIPELADCVIVTEPGALWRPGGTLDLAVGCPSAEPGIPIRIELLRSLDHGASFQWAGRLLEADEALCLRGGVSQVNAPDLFLSEGGVFLNVTPAGPIPGFDVAGYRGCFTLPLEEDGTRVARAPSGALDVVRAIDAPDGRFTGACSAAEGATALGYVVHELAIDARPFRALQAGSAP